MLPRTSRLSRDRDIARVASRGYHIAARYMRARVAPGTSKQSRATVVVSQRVAKSAVVRNRLKRQIRAVLPTLLSHMTSPIDIVIYAKPTALTADRPALIGAVQDLFDQIKQRSHA